MKLNNQKLNNHMKLYNHMNNGEGFEICPHYMITYDGVNLCGQRK